VQDRTTAMGGNAARFAAHVNRRDDRTVVGFVDASHAAATEHPARQTAAQLHATSDTGGQKKV
jgi:hypothetical protein